MKKPVFLHRQPLLGVEFYLNNNDKCFVLSFNKPKLWEWLYLYHQPFSRVRETEVRDDSVEKPMRLKTDWFLSQTLWDMAHGEGVNLDSGISHTHARTHLFPFPQNLWVVYKTHLHRCTEKSQSSADKPDGAVTFCVKSLVCIQSRQQPMKWIRIIVLLTCTKAFNKICFRFHLLPSMMKWLVSMLVTAAGDFFFLLSFFILL